MSASLAAVGANILGEAVGAYASRKSRRKAREMQRLKDEGINRSMDLGRQVADYSAKVGTPQDAMFYGGLAASKFKKNLADSKDALTRDLGRRGVSPASNAYLSRFGSSPSQELATAGAYNDALMGRINDGVSARQAGQSAILKPFNYADTQAQTYGEAAQAESDMAKGMFTKGASSVAGLDSVQGMFG